MAEELRLLYKSFNEILVLKQLAKYSNKYNKALSNFCEIIFKKLEDQNGILEKLIKFNCLALSAALEFSRNPNSELFDVVRIECSQETLENFLELIQDHLKFFKVTPELFEDYTSIRFNEIIQLNCKVFLELLDSSGIKTDIQLFNHLIKHLCLILFEIVTPRISNEYHDCFDVLQKRNSDTIKLLLELKIKALQKYTTNEKEPQSIPNILELHENLLREITGYINSTTDISESESSE